MIPACRPAALIALLLAALSAFGQTAGRILVQSSPLAGFQYYEGKALWEQMRIGDALTLVREPDNSHDPLAVRVEWKGNKLGYVPRRENQAVARQLDHGNPLEARIVRLVKHRDPWKRIEFEVFLRL
ncbi:MAG: HIRAN domain-containing protein [Gammaproteobacteria bacterium]|nr:HIRAN domain-containing protein [Gammaproteobacteria bacterium]